jgi:hypothetical protein
MTEKDNNMAGLEDPQRDLEKYFSGRELSCQIFETLHGIIDPAVSAWVNYFFCARCVRLIGVA